MSKFERFLNIIEIILFFIFIVVPVIIFVLFSDCIIFCINKILKIISKDYIHNIPYLSDRFLNEADYYCY